MSLLLIHAEQLMTMAGAPGARHGAAMAELGLVRDGAVLIEHGHILRAGPTDEVARNLPHGLSPVREVDCRGQLVTPGLVDSHTHLVFAAPRLEDYERRIGGQSYAEIAAAGGGIGSSVRRLREMEEAPLLEHAVHWLRQARRWGSTTVEIKSGYGLTLESERKMLRVAAQAAGATGMDVPRTFLGAHIAAPEGARSEYLKLVNGPMLEAFTNPEAAAYAPEFADVFCDPAGFSVAESREVLRAAQRQGLALKLHAEQFALLGGLALGLEMGAVSVDHLDAVDERGLRGLAQSRTVATLLPGSNLFLGHPGPPARKLIDAGAAVALATDFNPGTCPMIALPLIMSLGCSVLRMSPAEAWTAVTVNGAAALARGHLCGSLEVGKRADLALFDTGDYRAVPYFASANLCRAVIQAGQWIGFEGA